MSELNISTMPWTGERMVPQASDVATELFHWQRYLYFRPWYQDARVVDAASGEGYGTNYASVFATSAHGYDIARDAIEHGTSRYPSATFIRADVCEVDYSDADLVVSFETIEHVPSPSKFLKALATCTGRIVISTPNRNTHSPGNKLEDKPFNQFHTVEWTPSEFKELIEEHFPGRQVRFVSQESRWPGLIREGFDADAMYCIAVIGEGDLPQWPRIGISIPTYNNWNQLNDAIHSFSRSYPGEIKFAVVANGCNQENLKPMRELQASMPYLLHVIEETENRGFGQGANIGLDFLRREGGFDLYAVSNDDVIPATDCLCEMVAAMSELEKAGLHPGVIGPVSNSISGQQQVDIGTFSDYKSLVFRAESYHREHHSTVTQVQQLRGLFMLIHPKCLSAVGGFDPRFGIGNFEDDDHNLRCTLSGYSLWIAEGSFLYHHGSSTFKRLGIDYEANIARNCSLMVEKWELPSIEQWIHLSSNPASVSLFVPLTQPLQSGYEVKINGEVIDLINQASELEFAGWVMHKIKSKPREIRKAVIELIEGQKLSA
jgi:GT2 family glycosyltransferase